MALDIGRTSRLDVDVDRRSGAGQRHGQEHCSLIDFFSATRGFGHLGTAGISLYQSPWNKLHLRETSDEIGRCLIQALLTSDRLIQPLDLRGDVCTCPIRPACINITGDHVYWGTADGGFGNLTKTSSFLCRLG